MAASNPFLFVSHVSEDRAAAMQIVGELENRGHRCWIAPRDVHPGKPFDDEIVDAVDGCLAMLLIFSEHCNTSDYIRREVTIAGESAKPVIAFRIEEALPRKGLRVRLSDLHWIDAFVSHERAIDEVVKALATDNIQTLKAPAIGSEVAEDTNSSPSTSPAASSEQPKSTMSPLASVPHGGRRRLINLGAVAAVLLVCAGGVIYYLTHQGLPAPVLSSIKSAEEAAARKDYDRAIFDFTAAARLAPDNARILIGRGDAYREKLDYDDAIADHTLAIKIEPKNSLGYMGRGFDYFNHSIEDKGLADFNEAIRLDPNAAHAYFGLGIYHAYVKSNWRMAILDYTKAIDFKSDVSKFWFFRAHAEASSSDYDAALSDYNHLIQIDPSYGLAFCNRGLIYANLKKESYLAIADYTNCIGVLPKYGAAYYNRGLAKQQVGDAAGAAADMAKGKSLDPNLGH